MRDRVSDEACVARIRRDLARSAPPEVGQSASLAVGNRAISRAVGEMDALARAIMILIVARQMSVAEVSRRFGVSEGHVCPACE